LAISIDFELGKQLMLHRATVAASLSAIVLFVASGAALAGTPIQDLIGQPVPTKTDGKKMKVALVQQGIMEAAVQRQWTARVVKPGSISASILVRGKHFAEVTIDYTDSDYSIKYVSSRDLDYDEAKREIHKNYNKWVTLLNQQITLRLTTLASIP
jgi:hypothetical protein